MSKTNIIISETTQAIIDKRTDENGIATRAMMLCTKEHHDGIHVYMGGVDGATNFLVKRGENVAEAIEQVTSSEDEQDTTTTEETEGQEETAMTETKTTTSPLEAVYADIVNNTYREARAGMSHRKFWRVYELATEGNALLLAEDTETTESVDKVLGFFSDTIRHDIMNDPSGQALAAFAEAHRRYKTLGESLLLA